MNVRLALAAGVIAVTALASASVTRWYYLAEIAGLREAQRAAVDEANMRAAQAGHRYEEWKALQEPKVVVLERKVERVLEKHPEWAGARVPDGVRELVDNLPAELGAGKPAAALP